MKAILRQLLGHVTSASLVLQPAIALAAAPEANSALVPQEQVATSDYKPKDQLERSLWMEMDEAERDLKLSQHVIRDPALNDYVRKVFCKTVGAENCAPIRIYLIRTSSFNASMAPNGMMEVWSGLLLRAQNEAELSAILGHEYTHFQQRHTLRLYRDLRSKSSAATWLAMTGVGLIASFGMLADLFHHSRDMEQEADIGGLKFMANAGYDTREAAKIWEQLREEMDATAAARNTKSKKDKDRNIFADHPPSAERVAYLTEAARSVTGIQGNTGVAEYATAMDRYWPQFIDDQFKQNDFGASEYLIKSLASNGWSDWKVFAHGELYRRRANPGDLETAVGIFSSAINSVGRVPELWRGRGLALLKLGKSEEGKADLKEYLRRAPEAMDKALIKMMAGD